ncbi:MAG: TerB family tellurite resistance protein [Cellulosilyticaceae bacterium]
MELLFGLIQGILGFGLSIISFIFTVIIAGVIAVIALFKRRNAALWGLVGLFFPWAIVIIILLPTKYPKLSVEIRNHPAFKGKNPMVASIMALAAIVAKTDGAITKEEIALVKQFVTKHFGIMGDELNSYAEAFDYGKEHPEAYAEFARFVATYSNRMDVVRVIAYLLVSVAMQDGNISESEDMRLREILAQMGLSEYEYRSIKNSFTHEYDNSGYTGYSGGGGYNSAQSGMSQSALIKKHSEVLGVSECATMSEIKKAYRKLVKEYHPDKLASESMPEDYIAFANQKIIEINEAYEYLKKIKEA